VPRGAPEPRGTPDTPAGPATGAGPAVGAGAGAGAVRNPVGAHVPVAGGLAAKGLAYAGRIGAQPFRALLRDPATRGVPLVIETPGGPEGPAADVKLLQELREDRAGAGPATAGPGSAPESAPRP
jgi:hypothetical protein